MRMRVLTEETAFESGTFFPSSLFPPSLPLSFLEQIQKLILVFLLPDPHLLPTPTCSPHSSVPRILSGSQTFKLRLNSTSFSVSPN